MGKAVKQVHRRRCTHINLNRPWLAGTPRISVEFGGVGEVHTAFLRKAAHAVGSSAAYRKSGAFC